MFVRRYILFPLVLASLARLATAASDPVDPCSDSRRMIGEQITEARLKGDNARRTALEEQLQALATQCRGVTPVQPNHLAIERATRLAEQREAQLREALGSGDPTRIELSKRRLDHARRQLEAAKR